MMEVENMYEDWSVAMLCRKFNFATYEEGGLERTICNLPVDIEKQTGLKETLYYCHYANKGYCYLLDNKQ